MRNITKDLLPPVLIRYGMREAVRHHAHIVDNIGRSNEYYVYVGVEGPIVRSIDNVRDTIIEAISEKI
tara:strand:- start:84 stop:287 length:204 start_codon:yes stop_codon:yes gene_type:complete